MMASSSLSSLLHKRVPFTDRLPSGPPTTFIVHAVVFSITVAYPPQSLCPPCSIHLSVYQQGIEFLHPSICVETTSCYHQILQPSKHSADHIQIHDASNEFIKQVGQAEQGCQSRQSHPPSQVDHRCCQGEPPSFFQRRFRQRLGCIQAYQVTCFIDQENSVQCKYRVRCSQSTVKPSFGFRKSGKKHCKPANVRASTIVSWPSRQQ